MKRKKHVLTIEDAMSIATMDLSGLYDIMDRPRILFATAVARLAKSDEEAITALLYVAMSRGRFMEDVVDKTIMPASVKDALRQMSERYEDGVANPFQYMLNKVDLASDSTSQVNLDGSQLAMATLCHACMVEERMLMADLASVCGDTTYEGEREVTLEAIDPGCRMIEQQLEIKLVQVIRRKAALMEAFGGMWFVEGGGY